MNQLIFYTLALILLLVGCDDIGGKGSLPNGYSVFCTNPYTTVILSPDSINTVITIVDQHGNPIAHRSGSVVVGPKINDYKHENYIVWGYVSCSPESEVSEKSVPGYFVLNTSTHILHEGLDEYELDVVLDLYQSGK